MLRNTNQLLASLRSCATHTMVAADSDKATQSAPPVVMEQSNASFTDVIDVIATVAVDDEPEDVDASLEVAAADSPTGSSMANLDTAPQRQPMSSMDDFFNSDFVDTSDAPTGEASTTPHGGGSARKHSAAPRASGVATGRTLDAVVDATLGGGTVSCISDGSHSPISAPTTQSSSSLVAFTSGVVFMLVPTDAHYASSQQQEDPSVRKRYPMIPLAHCKASQLLTSFEESLAGGGAEFDDGDERGGGGGPQIIPVAVQGIHESVLALVAAYVVHFSGLSVQGASDFVAGAAFKPPTKLATPFPSTLSSFPSDGTLFEDDVFRRCDKDLSYCLGVMHAANFLGVASLVELASLSVALKLRGRAPHEFTTLFSTCAIPLADPVVE